MSTYFSIEEMRCHDGTSYPPEWVGDRLAALFTVLDAIREAWGGPLTVVCGYRTPAYNNALAEASAARNGGVSGVAKASQHVQGRAADIRPAFPTADRILSLHTKTLELYRSGGLPGLGGLGYYPNLWIHADVRFKVDGHLAQWNGSGSGSDK